MLSQDNNVRVENEVRNKLADNNVNSVDSIEDQSERQPLNTRARILTEKGQAYQEQCQRDRDRKEDDLIKKFNEVYEIWKERATEIESSLDSQLPLSQEKDEIIIGLNGLREAVHKVFEKLRQVRFPGQEILRKVDTCDASTRSLQQQLDAYSIKREPTRNDDDKRSLYSKASTRTRSSRVSRSSRASSLIELKKADAAAELAAKEAEFNVLQEESKHKEEIARIEAQLRAETTRIETELARRKLKLEQIEAKKHIEIARAKLKVYQEVEESEHDVDSVGDDLVCIHPTQTTSASLLQGEPLKHSTIVTNASKSTMQPTQRSQNVNGSSINNENDKLSHNQVHQIYSQDSPPHFDSTAAIVTAITDSFSMSRLPVPEPAVFDGEPIQYIDWKSSFHALIDRKNLLSSDKMYYLKRYVDGSAKEAISGLFLQSSSEAYERAWHILDERFGHPFIISKAYRDKLQQMAKDWCQR